ncbi:polysaccharide biosynthesis/export family protein [Thiorhodovibrio frisius]|uniref:Periplasmic protein involved in polysaccharide export n=1 Tax=Thiorhodovibrio frisius TaxID=631362 RepID=H8Z1U6_9GAMM|nr:polysaccharide biosynthesis/export family protein [Thiorhodovibrio frisius]EIC22574.1 periplasmic protein involved in polysaccharide export [Thiorhodovibrio frisius]WPL20015.1 Polysialic acid transport protein KpsD precursor [Thiorhodovibrio frisius]
MRWPLLRPVFRVGGVLVLLPWLLFAMAPAAAQGISADVDIPAEQRAEPMADTLEGPPRMQLRSMNYGPVTAAAAGREGAEGEIPPFGASLFQGGFRAMRVSGLNPSYRVMPGDQVTVRAWGALQLDAVLPVDAQGNVFIPQIGPVAVQGVSAGQLDARVRQAINGVYTDNVSVYTNLQGVQPVGVFVTGFVPSPGRYSGTPSDSVLNYLDQAGGVDLAAGSFRNIRVQRRDEVIAGVDLYPFLLEGRLPRLQFEEGDTIVVEGQGAMVTALGDVAQPYRYELAGCGETVRQLLAWVRLRPGVSHGLLSGMRQQGPIAEYLTLADLRQRRLHDGDTIDFSVDHRRDTIVVQIEGSFIGPSRFTIPKDARLTELLDSIPVQPQLADVESISIRRESVAQRQRESLNESLRRLETAYLGASSATVDEANIRVSEAKLIQDFVKRARELEVSGRLVVAKNGQITDVRLQNGDVITIPNRSDSIFVSGEVIVPQAMVYTDRLRAKDYIDRAGGFTDRADRGKILLARQSGEVVEASGADMRPGDEILVLPKVPVKNLELSKTLTQILYQIAVATKVALDL